MTLYHAKNINNVSILFTLLKYSLLKPISPQLSQHIQEGKKRQTELEAELAQVSNSKAEMSRQMEQEIQAFKKKAENSALLVKIHRNHAVELKEVKVKKNQLEKQLKTLQNQVKLYVEKVKAQFHEKDRLRAELEEKLENKCQEQAAKKTEEVKSEVEKMEEVVGVEAAKPR